MEKWCSIAEKPDEDCAAIYKIRLKSKNSITRLIGEDKDCILSIGETGDIKKRIRNFKRGTINGSEGSHSSGRTLYGINKYTKMNVTLDDLEYWYERKDSKPEAQEAEKEAIWDYVNTYGETPPLNGTIPKRKEWIEK